jgi:cytochrome c
MIPRLGLARPAPFLPWSLQLTAYCIGMALGVALPVMAARPCGDVGSGQRLFESRCIGCHSLDANRIGPALRGVFERGSGGTVDFGYSSALRDAQVLWDVENLDRWLSDPEAFLPGQRMGYSVASADDRADLIAYLASLSDKPASTSGQLPVFATCGE